MISIEPSYEKRRIGHLNAKELFELACFIAAKNGCDNNHYELEILLARAREKPETHIFEYTRNHVDNAATEVC